MARDEAKPDDEQITIGELKFVLAPDVKQLFIDQGGLHIDYRSNAWGGGFSVEFDRGGGC